MTSRGNLMTNWRGLKASQREEGLRKGSEGQLEGSEGYLEWSDDQPEGSDPAGSPGRVRSSVE